MLVQKIAAALLLLLLSGCAGIGAAPSEKAGGEELTIAARFQTERGDALYGGATQISTAERSGSYRVDSDGTVNISGLPRNGELLLTLFDQQQEVQGKITLRFSEGAVIDATTSEDGVGHITVRNDTREVALLFLLTDDGVLQCTLWLAVPANGDLPQKGV